MLQHFYPILRLSGQTLQFMKATMVLFFPELHHCIPHIYISAEKNSFLLLKAMNCFQMEEDGDLSLSEKS